MGMGSFNACIQWAVNWAFVASPQGVFASVAVTSNSPLTRLVPLGVVARWMATCRFVTAAHGVEASDDCRVSSTRATLLVAGKSLAMNKPLVNCPQGVSDPGATR